MLIFLRNIIINIIESIKMLIRRSLHDLCDENQFGIEECILLLSLYISFTCWMYKLQSIKWLCIYYNILLETNRYIML